MSTLRASDTAPDRAPGRAVGDPLVLASYIVRETTPLEKAIVVRAIVARGLADQDDMLDALGLSLDDMEETL